MRYRIKGPAAALLIILAAAAISACGGNSVVISKEQAEQTALGGFSPQASVSDIELTTDKGLALYEGVVRQDGREYEFEIDAETGLLLNVADAAAPPENAAAEPARTDDDGRKAKDDAPGTIGAETAQAIILERQPHFPIDGCTKATFGGKAVFLCSGSLDGENRLYIVDAQTGEILSAE